MSKYERDDTLIADTTSKPSNVETIIETTGEYVGVFIQAKQRVAKTGSKGIEFTFKSNEGGIARYLTLWLERTNGERIPYFYGLLSGLMACFKLRQIETVEAVSDEWDSSVGARVPTKIDSFSELLDRQVGVLLEREERVWEGRAHVSLRIVEFFDPVTRQTPPEIIAGDGATGRLTGLISGLTDRIQRTATPTIAAPSNTASIARQVVKYDQFAEDDIPF